MKEKEVIWLQEWNEDGIAFFLGILFDSLLYISYVLSSSSKPYSLHCKKQFLPCNLPAKRHLYRECHCSFILLSLVQHPQRVWRSDRNGGGLLDDHGCVVCTPGQMRSVSIVYHRFFDVWCKEPDNHTRLLYMYRGLWVPSNWIDRSDENVNFFCKRNIPSNLSYYINLLSS